jgi:putative membrane protein
VTLAHAPDVWQSGAWGTYAAGANSLNLGPEPPLSAEWQAGKATMYSRRRFRFRPLPVESWPLILIVSAWSIAVVILHEIVEFTWIVMPVLPVTLIGIAVSLFLGFKSVSAYNRWWEARTAIGSISGCSREWAMHVQSLIYKDTETVPAEVEEELFNRHLGLVYAVAYMLRRN